jgi:predicted permease
LQKCFGWLNIQSAQKTKSLKVTFRTFSGTVIEVVPMQLLEQFQFSVLRAIRSLCGDIRFTLIALISLAVGFGLNSAIVWSAWTSLTRPLPFDRGQELISIWESNSDQQIQEATVSAANFIDIQESSSSFESVAHAVVNRLPVRLQGEDEEFLSAQVSKDFARVLSVAPVLGRSLEESDFAPSAPRAVLLSYSSWQTRFGGRPEVLGRTITINSQPATVVGVMPRGVAFPFPLVSEPVDLWFPTMISAENSARRFHGLYVVGRLKGGVPLVQAQSELDVLAARLAQQYPNTNKGWRFLAIPLSTRVVRDSSRLLLILGIASSLLLLAAIANVTLLWLTRALTKSKDFGIRLAVGASRNSLLLDLLAETAVLSVLGGALGVALTFAFLAWLSRVASAFNIYLGDQPMLFDQRLVIATLLGSVILGTTAAFLPARYVIRQAESQTQSHLRSSRGSSAMYWTSGPLVLLQVAVSLTLLLGTCTLLQSFWRLVDAGANASRGKIASAQISLPVPRYAPPALRLRFSETILENLRRAPGIQAAALTSELSQADGGELRYSTDPNLTNPEAITLAKFYIVSEGYFETIGASLISGRTFRSEDLRQRPVVIVNEALAGSSWPQGNPLDKKLWIQNMGTDPYLVVGVVRNINHFQASSTPRPTVYLSMHARPQTRFWIVAQTTGSDAALIPSLFRTYTREIDPEVPLTGAATFSDLGSRVLLRPKLQLLIVASSAVLALILTVLGIYGLVSFQISRECKEIAIRWAIGASSYQLGAAHLKRTGVLLLVGVGSGFAGGLALSRLMAKIVLDAIAMPLPLGAAISCFVALAVAAAATIPFRAVLGPSLASHLNR